MGLRVQGSGLTVHGFGLGIRGLGFKVYSALSLRSEQMSATLQKVHHQNCGPTVFKTAEQRPNSLALPLGHPMETQGSRFEVWGLRLGV